MRLERYLEDRQDSIYDLASAFEEMLTATKLYADASEAVSEKSTEKTEKASELAWDARNKATEEFLKIIERLCGVRRYVVTEDE